MFSLISGFILSTLELYYGHNKFFAAVWTLVNLIIVLTIAVLWRPNELSH
jgi:hypothetical protein